jgi:hypothetical protein
LAVLLIVVVRHTPYRRAEEQDEADEFECVTHDGFLFRLIRRSAPGPCKTRGPRAPSIASLPAWLQPNQGCIRARQRTAGALVAQELKQDYHFFPP